MSTFCFLSNDWFIARSRTDALSNGFKTNWLISSFFRYNFGKWEIEIPGRLGVSFSRKSHTRWHRWCNVSTYPSWHETRCSRMRSSRALEPTTSWASTFPCPSCPTHPRPRIRCCRQANDRLGHRAIEDSRRASARSWSSPPTSRSCACRVER